MRRLSCLLLSALLVAASDVAAAGRRCVPCGFGGLCPRGDALEPCAPSEARCLPRRGILVFNSESGSAVPVYWTLFAERRPGPRGHLRGTLAGYVDAGFPTVMPGFPGYCGDEVCFAQEGWFTGRVKNDRLTGNVRYYADGSSCEFDIAIRFGFGEPQAPNRFVCRNGFGVVAEGRVRLRGIRLFGCRQ